VHKFEVKFGGPNDGYEIAQVSDAGNLNDSDLQNLEFQRASDQSVLSDISEARAEAGEVRAFLSIDPTGLLFPEPIEIGVQQQSVPTISCELKKSEIFESPGALVPLANLTPVKPTFRR
jgi:hypothetical protein